VEHVWVRPVSWSRFRIEGRLASWLHLLDGTIDGRREGGFTIDLLEQRHGPP
jgi:hypothetical protein